MQQLIPGEAWLGEVTVTDNNSDLHGKWLIGDKLPLGSPGHHVDLRYKRWCGHEKKYGQGYHVEPPVHQGRQEFVMVMVGEFECTVNDQTYYLQYPAGIELRPHVSRMWKLPPRAGYTEGVTICRFLTEEPVIPGGGPGYEFHVFDLDPYDDIPKFLKAPMTLKQWNYRFVDIFEGCLHFCIEAWCPMTVGYAHHVFMTNKGHPVIWKMPFSGSCVKGVVIYF